MSILLGHYEIQSSLIKFISSKAYSHNYVFPDVFIYLSYLITEHFGLPYVCIPAQLFGVFGVPLKVMTD